jgi:hypothetical protein
MSDSNVVDIGLSKSRVDERTIPSHFCLGMKGNGLGRFKSRFTANGHDQW